MNALETGPVFLALRVAAVLVGVALILVVLDAAIRTFMVPRPTSVLLCRWIGRVIGKITDLVAGEKRSYEWRDRIQAFRAPLTLLGYQATWLLIVFVGFTMIFWAVDGVSIGTASRESGSALFTLGFASPGGNGSLLLVYAEALIGLTLLALLISYLPTIYAAFQKREFMVSKLAVRAGAPARPWHALSVAHWTNSLNYMDSTMWAEWEDWFIEVAESHTSLAILNFYRSPDPNNHWLSSARAVLDTAALRVAVVDVPHSVGPQVTMRSGFLALRTLARYFKVSYEEDPSPDDPISITREQFDAAYRYMATSGVPVKGDVDQAWRDFRGWRVNYDSIIEKAAVVFNAPPNPWDSVIGAVSPVASGATRPILADQSRPPDDD